MRNFLLFFVCAVVVAFGAISMAQSLEAAGATGDDDDVQTTQGPFHDCHDDGDDGENPGVADDPDSEDDEESNPYGEVGDTEDMENPFEEDDPYNCRAILPDTASPSPTPICPSPIINVSGENCCPDDSNQQGDVFTCICPDGAGGEVNAEYQCSCENGNPLDCLCELGIPLCNGGFAPPDADCDGNVTVSDAYETLVVLSGFEASGECSAGDADCSDAVDAKDTLTILAVVAGLQEAASC